jgi:hypothetical protein
VSPRIRGGALLTTVIRHCIPDQGHEVIRLLVEPDPQIRLSELGRDLLGEDGVVRDAKVGEPVEEAVRGSRSPRSCRGDRKRCSPPLWGRPCRGSRDPPTRPARQARWVSRTGRRGCCPDRSSAPCRSTCKGLSYKARSSRGRLRTLLLEVVRQTTSRAFHLWGHLVIRFHAVGGCRGHSSHHQQEDYELQTDEDLARCVDGIVSFGRFVVNDRPSIQ